MTVFHVVVVVVYFTTLWFGDVYHMTEGKHPQQRLNSKIEGRRPRITWTNSVMLGVDDRGITTRR